MAKIPWYAINGSGKLGNLVFYKLFGKTCVRSRPGSYNKTPTPAQVPVRNKFIDAHRFAQSVIADPQLKAEYATRAAGKRTAYSQAMSEYLRSHINASH